MIETLATKFGALALGPLMLFGGHYGQAPERALAQTTVNDESCLVLEHTLRFGSSDRRTDGEVSELQAFLNEEGYLSARPTGSFGWGTWSAVRAYQKDEGIRVTGVVNQQTRAAIEEDSCDDGSETEGLAITSIDGPTALLVDEEGTWTVNVEGESDGLSYAVTWGDEDQGMFARFMAQNSTQSSSTFTHTYAEAGTYTPKFTVTDAEGREVAKSAAEVTVSEDGAVSISALSASKGYAGDRVSVTGEGFIEGTKVYVGSSEGTDVEIASETSLSFVIPALTKGSYEVYVENADGKNNALSFEVKEKAKTKVSVNGVDAPVRLAVDEEGTWTVHASTNAPSLSYSVVWGDEGGEMMRKSASVSTQTSSTFTHTYSEAGTYTPKFTVHAADGTSSSVSASVIVSE